MFIATTTTLTAAQTAVINALTANRLTGDITLAGDVLTVRGTFNPALLADNDGEGYLAWRNAARASLQGSIDGLGYEVMDIDYAGAASAGVWMATVQPMPTRMAKANKAAKAAKVAREPKQPKAAKLTAKVMEVTIKAGLAYRAYRTGLSGFIQGPSLADILAECEGREVTYTNLSAERVADILAGTVAPVVTPEPAAKKAPKAKATATATAKPEVTPAPKPAAKGKGAPKAERKPLTATVTAVESNGGGTSYNVQLSNLKSTLRVEAEDMDAKEAELVAAGYIVTYTAAATAA